ncbi:HAMP domain-containing histidine kinase [Cytobacillus spongiae]|jgi:signal transduction histidine kinase|uniref:HAMP domain-containing sensor histidine kinase n=1 Tax=Cytobacillus spongiae TaxID=2901381 RepID=UPI001F350029|nr:HAMP domain-containing sensor histidine kinase [Cytobacillus spongiae]UII56159.1 HAMP domain-containing histidine kinase [Cytobacillus spongiae]
MKLKHWLPIMFLSLFVTLILIMHFYIKQEVSNSVFGIVSGVKQELEAKNDDLVKKFQELSYDPVAVKEYVVSIQEDEQIGLTLYDQQLDEMIVQNSNIISKEYIITDWYSIEGKEGGTRYFLLVERPLHLKKSSFQSVVTQTTLFLLLVLITIFAALVVYFHYFITSPIEKLNKHLSKVSLRGPLPSLSTKRKDEIGELYHHVKHMEDRIHKAREEQVNMIAAIAHDLKTPLTSINGFLELMDTQKEMTDEQKKEYLKLIKKKSQHITELVNEFSSFSKGEMEIHELELDTVNLKTLFENIASEYEAELSGFDYELIWSHSFYENQTLLLNEKSMRRVFANIFSNAVKYSQKEDLKIYMKGFNDDERAIITIEDNGVGVPTEQLHHIFMRFFTVDQSRQTEQGGTGLGLATCKSIVERQGGIISAYRSPYGGLGIRIELDQE